MYVPEYLGWRLSDKTPTWYLPPGRVERPKSFNPDQHGVPEFCRLFRLVQSDIWNLIRAATCPREVHLGRLESHKTPLNWDYSHLGVYVGVLLWNWRRASPFLVAMRDLFLDMCRIAHKIDIRLSGCPNPSRLPGRAWGIGVCLWKPVLDFWAWNGIREQETDMRIQDACLFSLLWLLFLLRSLMGETGFCFRGLGVTCSNTRCGYYSYLTFMSLFPWGERVVLRRIWV